MEFREEYDAVYEGGVFRPEGPVNLPEKARVRVRADRAESPSDAARRLVQLAQEIRARGLLNSDGWKFNREELYDRG